MRRCVICGMEKEDSEFNFRKDTQKFRSDCKECRYAGLRLPGSKCLFCDEIFDAHGGQKVCGKKDCKERLLKTQIDNRREHYNAGRRSEDYHRRSKSWVIKFRVEQNERWGVGTVGQGNTENSKYAELSAIKILTQLGYKNIEHWSSDSFTFPYDIISKTDDKRYVFQVTTYPYTKKKLAHKFAKWAGFIHKVIFISLKRNEYVIRDFSDKGFARLSLKDEKDAKGF